MATTICRAVEPPIDLVAAASRLQSVKAINALARAVPSFGRAVRILNPQGTLTDNFARVTAALPIAREAMETRFRAAVSTLVDHDLPALFDLDEVGYSQIVAKSTKRTVKAHINDILDNPQKYVLNAEQHAAVNAGKAIWRDMKTYLKQNGGSDLNEDWFPREIKHFIDDKGNILTKDAGPGGYGSGVRSGSQRISGSRAKVGDTVQSADEMVRFGWRYVDPWESLTNKGLEMSRRIADLQYMQWASKQPWVVTKKQVRAAGGQVLGRNAMIVDNTSGKVTRLKAFEPSRAPGLSKYFIPEDVMAGIDELVSRPARADIPVLSKGASEVRSAIASFDFGTVGIQLMGALAADLGHLVRARPSAIFPKAIAGAVRYMKNPEYMQQYIKSNRAVIERWSAYLGGLHNSEYFTDVLGNLPENRILRVKHQLEQPTARFFEGSLDISKVEYAKSLEKIFGEALSETDKEALGMWIRSSTGQLSTQRLGVSPRQSAIEGTFLFFSPRFTRSLFAVTGSLLRMDKAGNEARLALGSLMTAGTAVYVAAAEALGQEPRLDPSKPGFLSIRVGDNWVGIGGGIRAMSRLTAASYDTAVNNPKAFISPDFTGEDQNPLLSFWRSRTSPLTGTAMDIWTGEDFRGAPIDDGTDWVNLVRDRTLPFVVQAAMEARGESFTRTGVALSSGLGLNANPLTSHQMYDTYLKDIRNADGSQRFPDGAGTVNTRDNHFADFIRSDPKAEQLKTARDSARREAASPGRDIQRILDDRKKRLDAADAMYDTTQDRILYRNQVNAIRADTRDAMKDLALEDAKSEGDKKIVSSYYAAYETAYDPITGGVDSDALDSLLAGWKQAHPGEYERLIEPNEVIGETPLESELRSDRKKIADSGWWETDDTAWKETIEKVAESESGRKLDLSHYKDRWDYEKQKRKDYYEIAVERGRESPELVADLLIQRDPVIGAFEKLRTRARLLLQRDNAGLTKLLAKWGYSTTSLQEYELGK